VLGILCGSSEAKRARFWEQQRSLGRLQTLVCDATVNDQQFADLVDRHIELNPDDRVIASYLVSERDKIRARKAWNDELDLQFARMDDHHLTSAERRTAKQLANLMLDSPTEQRYIYPS
jgi:hypothetical protein